MQEIGPKNEREAHLVDSSTVTIYPALPISICSVIHGLLHSHSYYFPRRFMALNIERRCEGAESGSEERSGARGARLKGASSRVL